MIGAIVFFVLLFGYFGIVKGESDSLKVFLAIIGIVAVVWLIGSFSNDNNGMTDLEDWYDILIIPYLQAVKKYFTYEHLQKYKFEQIFFRTLDSARSNYWRAMNRKMRCPSGGIYSYENLVCKRERDDLTGLECAENMAYLANGICNESAENEVVGTEMLKEALKTLDAEEQMIIKKKLYGYSDEEIYKSMGISVKKYNQILDRLIKAVEEVMYDV